VADDCWRCQRGEAARIRLLAQAGDVCAGLAVAGRIRGPISCKVAAGSPEALLNSIRQAIQSVDANLPLGQTRTFDEIVALDQANRRQQMFLLLAFASVSLVMAYLGIYAILAYTVELRRHEMGVRMALGASKGDLVRMVTSDGMKLAASGSLGGILGDVAGARVLRASLYEVQRFDPLTLAAVCVVLALVAFLACWIPSRRAAGTAPAEALRV
jgi:putative ABC transport system permease protein